VYKSQALFIHTLKFKGYIGARTGALAYEASFPWMGYYFFLLAYEIKANMDMAIVCVIAVFLNFQTTRSRPIWHVYQVILCAILAYHVYYVEEQGWPHLSHVTKNLAAMHWPSISQSVNGTLDSVFTSSAAIPVVDSFKSAL
jgi:hypothetical protein